ncbi:MAG: Na+ dependent nucleoside transporter [Saprospiraceae bacterium]|nr:Na+ dependent nucleoside transporter [Saprospiraceae bacterium]MDP4812891.1 Na+ dependent nucleoside transporter [Saprospiraceae bacterium]MDP4915015.1 Na+ dependent nucleoside transporter [Saprospiraceae bacterium]MDP5047157.1 Na+ dependent nucleoside transporter [Saprospiraceae bacterium]
MDLLITISRATLGMSVLIGIGYLLSSHKKSIAWRTIFLGILLQFILAVLVLKVPFINKGFDYAAGFFQVILKFSEEGATFLFGNLVSDTKSFGYIFAFQVLPTIVFFSAVSSILYYFGILQKIIYVLAIIMKKTLGVTGPESLAAAANIFVGQTEAPLVVKPYISSFTRSELMCLMTGGMATIAGGVFAAYVGFLGGDDPVQQLFFAKHLLTASIISAPAAIVAAKLIVPETVEKSAEANLEVIEDNGNNLLDAISRGTTDGLKLAINVGAMLLVFTALVYMLNDFIFQFPGKWLGVNEYIKETTSGRFEGLTFTYILGLIFAPIAWLLGTPSQDIVIVGQLLGQKTVINEFVAYSDLGLLRDKGIVLDPKSLIIVTYALCGFSNFASIGIQIGGISALAPNKRQELTELGFKAMVGGTIACFMTAIIASVLYYF